jgi:MSHA pilin protein MshA
MQSISHQTESGFTMLELVIVIVIVGILAAVAVPKLTGLREDAQLAATQGMAGVLGSASANNYAVRNTLGTTQGGAVTTCSAIGLSSVLAGGLPSGYTVTGSFAGGTASLATCTVTGGTGVGGVATTATFIGHRIP